MDAPIQETRLQLDGETVGVEMNITDLSQQLTLPLLTDKPPFMLAGCELDFGSEEWAWLFLRLNKKYVAAYSLISSNPVNENFAIHLVDKIENVNIRPDVDGKCGKEFGLSAWLNPALKKLPGLRNEGSWFFPLMRPAPAAASLPQSIERPQFNEHPLRIKAHPEPLLLAYESPFGFQALPQARSDTARQMFTTTRQRDWILTAVDCSRPIAAQMGALVHLAKIKRKYLRLHGRITHDNLQLFRPREFTECTRHPDEVNDHASTASEWPPNIKEFNEFPNNWRVIGIDPLGPIGIQEKELMRLLGDAQTLIDDKTSLAPPIPGSFWGPLPTRNLRGTARNGGSYLKALLCLAELRDLVGTKGGLPGINQIIAAIPAQISRRDPANAWRVDFEAHIELKYLPQANDLIDGGYKWLIYAQKPKPSVSRKVAKIRKRPCPANHNRRVRTGWDE